ncbi:MAG: STAS domain-containing protein [Chloroflexota bacterium]|nr:STAS domain-containing protein [Chloroflexota bacterium]
MINIQVSNLQDVTLVQVNGRIDSTNANRLGAALTDEIDNGHTRIVLDLSSVEYMSSAGLREIVMAYKRVQRSAGDVRIAHPSDRVMEVLEVSGLDSVFQIFPSQGEAVGSY